MAHPEQLDFVARMVRKHGLDSAETVWEVGSQNINGSPRQFFAHGTGRYVGFDVVAGPGVDIVVSDGFHAWTNATQADVILCCEVLEHDPYAEQTIESMVRALAPGGYLLLTIAGPNRPEHGTRRTGNEWGPNPDFYRNVSLPLLRQWTDRFEWETREYEERADPSDVYFCGRKKAQ